MNPIVHRQTLADLLRRSAKRAPSKLAIVCGDTRWSYREFDAVCERVAAALAERGIAKGSRVAVLARNSHAFAALRFALARLGAVLVPINFMLKPEEAAYILRHAGATMLATDSGLAALARAAAALDTAVRDFVWLPSEEPSEPVAGMTPFGALASSTAALPDVALCGSDLAQIVYTSGTESLPKGAMLTHEAVIWQYVSCVVDASIESSDLTLHALPLYHCAQLDVFLGPSVYLGTTNVITGQPTPGWVMDRQLAEFFDIRRLQANPESIGTDVNLLMVVHPKNVSVETQYAIDQFVLRGGHLLVFVDPDAESDPTGNVIDPIQGAQTRASDLPLLFKSWGVAYDPGKVVLDIWVDPLAA